MRPAPLGGLRRDRAGQTSVFFALAAMVFICFLAFMVNLGQVLHDRMLIQTTADLVAFSGANTQAAGLNEIADLNLEVQQLADDLQMDLLWGARIWASQADALMCIQYYESWIQHTHRLQDRASRSFATGASDVAKQVFQWFNGQYGGGGGKPDKQGLAGRAAFAMQEFMASPVPTSNFGQFTYDKLTVSYLFIQPVFPPPPPTLAWVWMGGSGYPRGMGRHFMMSTMVSGIIVGGSYTLDTLANKDEDQSVYYRVRMSRPEVKPYVNMPDYGFDVRIPALEAFALVQPTGGHIHDLTPRYKARFMPLRTEYSNDVEVPNRGKFRH